MLLLVGMASCVYDNEEPQPEEPTETMSTLVLHTSNMVGDERTLASESLIEQMHKLRLIIISSTGLVEVNHMIDFGTVVKDEYYGIYRLQPYQDKYIYAIANPESCNFDFDSFKVGSNDGANFRRLLEEHAFTFDASRPIVMTDSRVVKASEMVRGERKEIQMNLVRAATKFSVRIINLRDEDVVFKNMTVHGLAQKEYLYPKFTGEKDGVTLNGYNVVNINGVSPFDFHTVAGVNSTDIALRDMHWSDWLKYTSDESWETPSDTTLADKRGWIMKYAIPEPNTVVDGKFRFSEATIVQGQRIQKGDTIQLETMYFAESRSGVLPVSSFGNGAAAGYEQQYTFDITFESEETVGGGTKQFTNEVFHNLRALFRNTHVLVYIRLYQKKVTATVRLAPYVGIELKPGFGWDHLPDKESDPAV